MMSGHQSVPYAFIDPIPLSVIPFAEIIGSSFWWLRLAFVAVRLLSELVVVALLSCC